MTILSNIALNKETSFGCGGMAKFFVEVLSLTEFKNLLKLHKGKYFILGNGTKTLCKDEGYDGLVISTKKLNKIEKVGNEIVCECGANFYQIFNFLANNNLSGFENLYGIPASIGGAVVMNAGAFKKEIADFVKKVEIFENGNIITLSRDQIDFGYRNSSLKGKNIFRVWLGNFSYLEREEILSLGNFFLEKRKALQPLGQKSAGSIFKRKGEIIPAKIIDKLGLKGVKIGGAEISNKHSGFIVNTGTATASDVLKMIDFIKEKVLKTSGIELENELIIME